MNYTIGNEKFQSVVFVKKKGPVLSVFLELQRKPWCAKATDFKCEHAYLGLVTEYLT